MPIIFFDNAYFLLSLGWALANSFWQAGVLWFIYKAITGSNKNLSALIKYHLSLALLFLSFLWFGFTHVQNYQLLQQAHSPYTKNWLIKFQQLTALLPFLAVAYFAVLFFYIINFFQHYFKLRFISTRKLLKPPADIRIFIAKTALHLGIKKKVTVWLSVHIDVPSVTGFIKPIILLPVAVINNLSIEQLNAILLHELAHIKRNDYLLNFFQSIIALVLFFNPFAILLSNAAKKERENCCDDWVLSYQFNQLEYAKALLVLEEQRHQQIVLALAATDNKKILLGRIKRLFTIQTPETSINFFQKFKLTGLCVLLFTGIYIVVPSLENRYSYKKDKAVSIINKSILTPQHIVATRHNALQENPAPIIFDKNPARFLSKKALTKNSTSTKKQSLINSYNNDYVLAMINEDALNNKSAESIVTAISSREKDSLLSVLVKIEEEQSGKKQINTYYFKLKNNNGNTDITPLLIINSYKASRQKNSIKKLPVTKLIFGKKRITT